VGPATPVGNAPSQPAPARNDNSGGDGAAVAVGIEVGGEILGGILHAIRKHNDTKVVSYNWILSSDGTLHCFGLNKAGQLANNNSVEDSSCANIAQPVTYNLENNQDGSQSCYEIYTPDNSTMNNDNPVDDQNCQAPQAQDQDNQDQQ
jgi:hypothetical protein